MDKSYVVNCVRSFAEKVARELEVSQVILFGSYAKGTANADSDIDVAVVTSSPVRDWLETSARLYRLGGDINLFIEPILLDLKTDRSGCLEEIRKTGEVIYDRECV